MTGRDRLRELPSVDRLATSVARAELDARRAELLAGATGEADLVARARERLRPHLRRVLNATGVVVHTNLGRAPLSEQARAAVALAAQGYCNLELDLRSGDRGARHDHVESLLAELTGAQAAIAVNNCAAAVLLAVAALGGGRETIVSRGQLIEIGGGFRIPEVLGQAGTRLIEVGTTNRTRLADYVAAIGDETGAILRAHPSNFRTLGFVEEVAIEALCELDVPVIDDIGSGVLADDMALLADEPAVRRSVRAGAAVVAFSGDKLLGGPQAGRPRRDARGDRRLPRAPARARRADRQALGRRARGDARALPRPGRRARRAAGSRDARRRPTAARRARDGSGAGDRRGGRRGDRARRRRRAAAARAARPCRRAGPRPRRRRRVRGRAARGRPGARRPHPRGACCCSIRAPSPTRRRARRPGSCARRGRERRAADARDRRPHRPRQDGARRRAHGSRYGPPARGARARHVDRARLRAAGPALGAARCRSSTSRATSASCARWSPGRPASTSTS